MAPTNNRKQPILLSGSSNKPLAIAIANILQIPLNKTIISKFSDGEIKIQLPNNLTNKEIIIIQSTSHPVNNHLLELLLLANAIHNAGATSITAIIPYFGYARQNQIEIQTAKACIEPNSAQIIAKLLETSGINKIITIDLHTPKISQFFQIPCINLDNSNPILADLKCKQLNNLTIVAPDLGSLMRAQIIAAKLNNAEFALIYKHRLISSKVTNTKVIGQIKNRNCIIIDDIVDTADTICIAAETLKSLKAKQIIAYCTHPVLSGNAIQNINKSALTEVIVTDTIQLSLTVKNLRKIRQMSVVQIIADSLMGRNGASLEISF